MTQAAEISRVSATPGLARTIRQLVDPAFGIATRFVELGADPLAADIFVACAEGGPPSYMIGHKRAKWENCSSASGAAYTREGACWATMGELAERYCASIYNRADLLHASATDLGEVALPVQDMILFGDDQYRRRGFPFARFDPALRTQWAEGKNMRTAQRVYAPAQLLYLSYEWADQMLMQTVSTGLACHNNSEAAHLSALLELVERDGFAAAWLLGLALPQLELSPRDKAKLSAQTRRALAGGALEIELRAIPNTFGVANIVAFVTHKKLGFGVVGASAALCPFKAIEKAVVEALHGWIGFSQTGLSLGDKTTPTLDQIKTPHDHALHYMDSARWRELAWFMAGEDALPVESLTNGADLQSADDLVARLYEQGYRTYAFDLTTDDLASLGLQVVRVIAPGLQPLSFGETPISQDRRRLATLAAQWGVTMPGTLTTQPHPFP